MPAEPLAGASPRVIVSDIDGTLVDRGRPTAGLETLRLLLEVHRGSTRIVYATGRSFESTWSLVDSGILPEPDAVASFVGTEVWLPPWKRMDAGFAAHISPRWSREDVYDVAGLFRRLELQPVRYQTPYKVSYYVTHPPTAARFRRELSDLGVDARVVYSGGRFLDVIPPRAGKRGAAGYVLGRWDLERPLVLACGDSLNDRDLIGCDGYHGVVVGNGEEGLRALHGEPRVHLAVLPHAAGVLEGAEAFGFWPSHDGSVERPEPRPRRARPRARVSLPAIAHLLGSTRGNTTDSCQ